MEQPPSTLRDPPFEAVEIVVNGEPRVVAWGTSIADMLLELAVEPRRVAVEINGELVPRDCHPRHHLAAGDRVEVVTFVGGG